MPGLAVGNNVVSAVVGWGLPLLEACLAIGFLVMALLQLLKMFGLRQWFHRNVLLRWIAEGGTPSADASHTLKRLCFPNRLEHVLNLPIEQVCGQLLARAEALVLELDDDQSSSRKEAEHLLAVLERRLDPRSIGSSEKTSHAEARPTSTVTQRIQNNVDALQIEASVRWRRTIWSSALLLSMGLSIVGIGIFGYRDRHPGTADLLAPLFVGIFGGVFATIARDLVALLEKLRR